MTVVLDALRALGGNNKAETAQATILPVHAPCPSTALPGCAPTPVVS